MSCKVKIGRTSNGQRYAVKIINKGDQFTELVQIEVDVLKKLHHENIVNFIEMGHDTLHHFKKEKK